MSEAAAMLMPLSMLRKAAKAIEGHGTKSGHMGESKRFLTVQPPAGPSTSGGTQSRQALMMDVGNEHPVCGFVDFVNAEAEVKDSVCARQAFELRHPHPLDVSEAGYGRRTLARVSVTPFEGPIQGKRQE
jgi:hypothetical protein